MKKSQTLSPFILALISLSFTACTTTPDPEEICTTEWIAPRAEKAVKKIEKKTNSAMNSLRKAGEAYSQGKQPSVFTMMRLSSSLEKLEKELTDGQGISDIKFLARTCNDPEILTKSVRNVFESQGVPEKLLNFIENTNLYQSIIDENLNDIQLNINSPSQGNST
ncbi:hypothetical protein DES40_0894 [Litorimonas taeanensis]|uniref:Lipoprotein n=2 Tax=Litorimonas taeanensis TaxID=568099 RepID=A0A420WKS1_9PROT|nr:hypothetical protein DES40_0894 [Litorimonas taeanensis]